jgi:hypothetical protein
MYLWYGQPRGPTQPRTRMSSNGSRHRQQNSCPQVPDPTVNSSLIHKKWLLLTTGDITAVVAPMNWSMQCGQAFVFLNTISTSFFSRSSACLPSYSSHVFPFMPWNTMVYTSTESALGTNHLGAMVLMNLPVSAYGSQAPVEDGHPVQMPYLVDTIVSGYVSVAPAWSERVVAWERTCVNGVTQSPKVSRSFHCPTSSQFKGSEQEEYRISDHPFTLILTFIQSRKHSRQIAGSCLHFAVSFLCGKRLQCRCWESASFIRSARPVLLGYGAHDCFFSHSRDFIFFDLLDSGSKRWRCCERLRRVAAIRIGLARMKVAMAVGLSVGGGCLWSKNPVDQSI